MLTLDMTALNDAQAAPQPVDNSNTLKPIFTLQLPARNVKLSISGMVTGAGPLTGLQLTVAANRGGTHVPVLINTDFDTATQFLRRSTLNPHTTAPGGSFQFQIDADAVREIAIWASSAAGCNLAIEAGYANYGSAGTNYGSTGAWGSNG